MPRTEPQGGAALPRSCSIFSDPGGRAGAGGLEGAWRPGSGAGGGAGGISAENISGDTAATGVACGCGRRWEELNAGALGSIPPETTVSRGRAPAGGGAFERQGVEGELRAVLRELLRGAGALLWEWAELCKKNWKRGR